MTKTLITVIAIYLLKQLQFADIDTAGAMVLSKRMIRDAIVTFATTLLTHLPR